MLSKEKVEEVLLKMGMPANVKGFGYIVDSILIMGEESNLKITYLYFKVAKLNNTTGQRVERAIRHAFEIVRGCRGDYDVVNYYIGFINCTNSASLYMLTMKIQEEIQESSEPQKKGSEKKDELHLTGITEERLLELIRQVYMEFREDIAMQLKK